MVLGLVANGSGEHATIPRSKVVVVVREGETYEAHIALWEEGQIRRCRVLDSEMDPPTSRSRLHRVKKERHGKQMLSTTRKMV